MAPRSAREEPISSPSKYREFSSCRLTGNHFSHFAVDDTAVFSRHLSSATKGPRQAFTQQVLLVPSSQETHQVPQIFPFILCVTCLLDLPRWQVNRGSRTYKLYKCLCVLIAPRHWEHLHRCSLRSDSTKRVLRTHSQPAST